MLVAIDAKYYNNAKSYKPLFLPFGVNAFCVNWYGLQM